MARDELVVDGKATSGPFSSAKPKELLVKHYEGGWEVHLAIANPTKKGGPGPRGEAAMRVRPEEAEVLAEVLLEYAAFAREARP